MLTNISDEVLRNWNLSFDTDFTIYNIWEASIKKHAGQTYVIGYADWNQVIAPGDSVKIGFTGKYTGQLKPPVDYTLENAGTKPEEVNCEVTYNRTSAWQEAYQGIITIWNKSDQKLVDWTLEFDFDGEIAQLYIADIVSHIGNHYILRGKDYNRNILKNSSLNLQFQVSTPNTPLELKNIIIH